MRYLLTGEEMKRCDDYTSQTLGIPSVVLMERASLAVADAASARLRDAGMEQAGTVLVLAGTGNNGADGLAAGRILAERGAQVQYITSGGTVREDSLFALQRRILASHGADISVWPEDGRIPSAFEGQTPDIVIDALFGTGLARELRGTAAEMVRYMEDLRRKGSWLIAVDIPSGIRSEDGSVAGCAVHCDETVTFAFCKRGHYLYPGTGYCGRITCAQIGITDASFPALGDSGRPRMFTYDTEDAGSLLPSRLSDGNKGTFGKITVAGGSRGMCGAVLLCAESAMRAGAGMVRIFTHESNRVIVQTRLPEALLTTYTDEDAAQQLRSALAWADYAVLGPGLGRDETARTILDTFLAVLSEEQGETGRSALRGAVMDADALRLLAEREDFASLLAARRQARELILTPHMGEFAALRHKEIPFCKAHTEEEARALASAAGCTVICKDARTLTADRTGGPVFLNTKGNSGMATAGSGDVLAGICGAYLARTQEAFRAACAAVLAHAQAGDRAAQRLGKDGMIAGDITDALREHAEPESAETASAPKILLPGVDSCSRTWAEIDLRALRANLDAMKARLKDGTGIIAVVKTDGYGHGAVRIARMLEEVPYIRGYAAAAFEEALELRRAGIRKPILLLGYVFPYCYRLLARYAIRPAVFRRDMLTQLSEAAAAEGRAIRIHIAVDTGMGRIGITPDARGLAFVREAMETPGIEVEGIFSHFARADETDPSHADLQSERFSAFLRMLEEAGLHIPVRHIANSAGILVRPQDQYDLTRAGITMYGLWPSEDMRATEFPLRPVLSWRTRIVYIKTVPAGTAISYGGTFVTERETRVATLPVGYGDGYPRQLSGKAYVLIAGHRAPILGRVCMDQLMADVTDIPEAAEGSTATLIGTDGGESIRCEELGELSGRFNYELVCCISKRVPRVYI